MGGNPAAPEQESAINSTRRALTALGCAALVAAAATGCGTTKADPGQRVQQAVTALGKGRAMKLDVSFDGSADAIYAAMRHEDDFSKQDADLLAGVRASVSLGSSTGLAKSTSDNQTVGLRLSFDRGRTQAVEYRSVHGKLYVRTDLKAVSALPSMPADDRRQIAALRSSAASMPASAAPVKAAIEGKWVSIDPLAFGAFAKSMGAPAGGGPFGSQGGGSAKESAAQKKIAATVRGVLLHDATYTDEGTRGGLDHVKVTLPAAKAGRELAKDLKPLTGQLPGAPPLDALTKIPVKRLSLDLGLGGGRLRTLSVDLSQLDRKMSGRLPLVITFSPGAGDLTAPAGAVAVSPRQLFGALASMGGASDASGSGGGKP